MGDLPTIDPLAADDIYRDGYSQDPSDTYIVVMGRTGAGKSTFISKCTEHEVDTWGGMKSCTQKMKVYRCHHITSRNVYLVDTPGFDDSDRADSDVLKTIAKWLGHSYKDGVKLSGVLYLYDAQTMKAYGSSLTRLRLFNKILGNGEQRSEVVKNVVFVTTMWNKLEATAQVEAQRRWEEFFAGNDFLGRLRKEGARDWRFLNSQDSALDLLRSMMPPDESAAAKIVLGLQEELVGNGLSLAETDAGRMTYDKLEEIGQYTKAEISDLQEELQQTSEADDIERDLLLKESKEKEQDLAEVSKIQEELELLRVNEQARMKEAEDYRRALEKRLQQHRQNLGTTEDTGDLGVTQLDNSEGRMADNSKTADGIPSSNANGILGLQYSDEGLMLASELVSKPESPYPAWAAGSTHANDSRVGATPTAAPWRPALSGIPTGAPDITAEAWLLSSIINVCELGDFQKLANLLKLYQGSANMSLGEYRNTDGRTLLHIAAQHGTENLVETLLKVIGDPCLFVFDNQGHRPIHSAVLAGDLGIVRLFLKGMSPEEIFTIDTAGFTPLTLAITRGFSSIAAEISTYNRRHLPNIHTEGLRKILWKLNDLDILERCLRYCNGGDQSFWKAYFDNSEAATLLHIALGGNLKTAQIIIRALKDAPLDTQMWLLTAESSLGFTAIARAALAGNISQIIEFINQFGSIVRPRTILNYSSTAGSPYFLAYTRGHVLCCKELVRRGVDPNATNFGVSVQEWNSSIEGAPLAGEIIRPLLKPGIRLFDPRKISFTPLSADKRAELKERQLAILNTPIEVLSCDLKMIRLLAYYYFYLMEAAERKKIFRAKLLGNPPCAGDNEKGTALYALSAYMFRKGIVRPGDLRCEGCRGNIEQVFYTCTSCPHTEFCVDCEARKSLRIWEHDYVQLGNPRERCHLYHIWAYVNFDSYNFERGGYIYPNKSIRDYFEHLRMEEKIDPSWSRSQTSQREVYPSYRLDVRQKSPVELPSQSQIFELPS